MARRTYTHTHILRGPTQYILRLGTVNVFAGVPDGEVL